LVLGGLIYNTYLCAKYGVRIAGVEVSVFFYLPFHKIYLC
jgi:hypothetical protein